MNSKTITTLGISKLHTNHSFLPIFSGGLKDGTAFNEKVLLQTKYLIKYSPIATNCFEVGVLENIRKVGIL